VFRFAGLGYAPCCSPQSSTAANVRPAGLGSWAVIAVMAAWTVATYHGLRPPGAAHPAPAEHRPRRPRPSCCLFHRGPAVPGRDFGTGDAEWTGILGGLGRLLAWRFASYGRPSGARFAALILSGCEAFSLRSESNHRGAQRSGCSCCWPAWSSATWARIAAEVETERQHAVEVEAASQGERERLARDIHDSVLQVLAMAAAARRGGGAAPRPSSGRLAGQQEARAAFLVASVPVGGGPAASPSGDVDLRALVLPSSRIRWNVSAPAQSVRLEKEAAGS